MFAKRKLSEHSPLPWRVDRTLESIKYAFREYPWLHSFHVRPQQITGSYGIDGEAFVAWRVDVLVPHDDGREDWMHEGKFMWGMCAYRLYFLPDGATLLAIRREKRTLYADEKFEECLGDLAELLYRKEYLSA